MPINIGDALLMLGVDPSGLDKGMKDAKASVEKAAKAMQEHMRLVGAALLAAGAAGLKMADDSRKLNAQLGVTAITVGSTTKEMRDLTMATANVTFPIKDVAATFDLLARAGIRNTAEMQKSANAFDALADALGGQASVMAEYLIPAYKAFGREIPTTTKEMDSFTWLVRNTLVDIQDFGNAMTYLAPEMDKLGISMEDAVVILAALDAKGISGAASTRELRKAVTEAVNENKSLAETLGLTTEEIGKFQAQIEGAAGATQRYAEEANKQYGLVQKLKFEFEKLTLSLGGFLEPLEPVLAGMTGLGTLMIGLSLVQIPKLIVAVKTLGGAFLTFFASPAGLVILALAATAGAIYVVTEKVREQKEELEKLTNAWEVAREKAIAASEALRPAETPLDAKETLKIIQQFSYDSATALAEVERAWLKIAEAEAEARQELERLAEETQAQTQAELTLKAQELLRQEMEKAIAAGESYHKTLDDMYAAVAVLDAERQAKAREEVNRLEEARRKAEEETRRELEALMKGWTDFLLATSDAVKTFRATGLTVEQILKGWAEISGRTRYDIVNDLIALGVSIEDISSKWQELGIPLEDIAARYDAITDAADEAVRAQRRLQEAISPKAPGVFLPPLAEDIEEAYAALMSNLARWGMPPPERIPTIETFGELVTEYWREGVTMPIIAALDRLQAILAPATLPMYQHGGIIDQPTLLTSLKTMRPYAVAGEAGREYITPERGYKTANILVQIDGETIIRVLGQPLVDTIRLRQGLRI